MHSDARARDEAVADVLGNILLVGITVTMMAGLSFLVLSMPGPPNQVISDLDISIAPGTGGWGTGDEQILIRHLGGEPVTGSTEIYLSRDDVIAHLPANTGGFADGSFTIGEIWLGTTTIHLGVQVEVALLHHPTNQLLSSAKAVSGGVLGAAYPAPVAAYTYNCVLLYCTFDGTGSTDDGPIADYAWDWGDGTAAGTTSTPTHIFAASGQYDVTLAVTDYLGATGAVTQTVVAGQAPAACFTFEATGFLLEVDGACSTAWGGGTGVAYDWTWNSPSEVTAGPTSQHDFALPGVVTVTLKVTDGVGQTAETQHTVTLYHAPVDMTGLETFALVSHGALTITSDSTVAGDVALSSGAAYSGGGTVTGAEHINTQPAFDAQTQHGLAYADAQSRTISPTSIGALSNTILVPGLYVGGGAVGVTGTHLTFDAQGDSNAVFIIKVNGALTVAAGVEMTLVGGAKAENIFWQVTDAASFGASTTLKGNYFVEDALGVGATVAIEGRLMTTTGSLAFGATVVMTLPTYTGAYQDVACDGVYNDGIDPQISQIQLNTGTLNVGASCLVIPSGVAPLSVVNVNWDAHGIVLRTSVTASNDIDIDTGTGTVDLDGMTLQAGGDLFVHGDGPFTLVGATLRTTGPVADDIHVGWSNTASQRPSSIAAQNAQFIAADDVRLHSDGDIHIENARLESLSDGDNLHATVPNGFTIFVQGATIIDQDGNLNVTPNGSASGIPAQGGTN